MSNIKTTEESLLYSIWFNQTALPCEKNERTKQRIRNNIETGLKWADELNINFNDQNKALAAAQNNQPFTGLEFDCLNNKLK
jgi:hypothetical protein